jgi:hypothetical protein
MPERSPLASLNARERNRRWATTHRACARPKPWLAGAPPYETHLRGGAMTMAIDPIPRWPIELRNTRALHGALTNLLGEPHARFPLWSLIPWRNGWSVYWAHDDHAERMALRTVAGELFGVPTRFRFGPRIRFRNPRVALRGHLSIRLDTITPVVWTNGGRAKAITCPSSSHVASSIGAEFLRRITLSEMWETWVRERIVCEIIDRDTQPAHTPLGGKYGMVAGWIGSLVLDVNATTLWALRVAERIGLGSRTAFGFGRIHIEENCNGKR